MAESCLYLIVYVDVVVAKSDRKLKRKETQIITLEYILSVKDLIWLRYIFRSCRSQIRSKSEREKILIIV
jgi:hypothetical protein